MSNTVKSLSSNAAACAGLGIARTTTVDLHVIRYRSISSLASAQALVLSHAVVGVDEVGVVLLQLGNRLATEVACRFHLARWGIGVAVSAVINRAALGVKRLFCYKSAKSGVCF
jgi:hypothetical protein